MEYELRAKNADLTKILFVGKPPDERVQKCSGENCISNCLDENKNRRNSSRILEFCGLSFEEYLLDKLLTEH
jgi:hypothetical protein